MTLSGGPPRLYAHRGAAAEMPENTVPSFARALEHGASALEMDLHMTSDGHVVVSHDPDGARLCGVAHEIKKTTLADLRTWDAGWGYIDAAGQRSFQGRGLRIPLLEEVLDAFPGIPLNVDVKQEQPSMVPTLLALLERRGAADRVLVASFRTATLHEVRRRGYPGATGLAQSEVIRLRFVPTMLLSGLPLKGARAQVPVSAGGVRLDGASFIAKCHKLGIAVDYWTINDVAEASRLLRLGADGIMTDDPRAIAPVFRGG